MRRALLLGHLLLTVVAGAGHAQLVTTLPGEDRPLAPTLTEVYRLGSANADVDWQIFSAVPAAVFDGDGNLYLLDSAGRVVIVGPPFFGRSANRNVRGSVGPALVRSVTACGWIGLVVFLEKDEFDVPVIVVKRLPPSLR